MNDEQLLRYSRQIMLPEFDYAGQQRLLAARVLVVGLGGLGCPAAIYLAAAGVGELALADYDEVDLSNLQRQIAHRQQDVGRLKTASATETLAAINSDVRVEAISEKLSGRLLEDAVARVDLVLDCSDNFATRFALNEACVRLRRPLVSGAAIRSEGQLAVFDGGACYRCLYADSDDSQLNCSENGVLAPVVGIIGTLQALEAIKLLSGFGEPLRDRLLVLDFNTMEWRRLNLRRDPDCPVCASVNR